LFEEGGDILATAPSTPAAIDVALDALKGAEGLGHAGRRLAEMLPDWPEEARLALLRAACRALLERRERRPLPADKPAP
jgi:hypothetical protein